MNTPRVSQVLNGVKNLTFKEKEEFIHTLSEYIHNDVQGFRSLKGFSFGTGPKEDTCVCCGK